jgi:hypothetical protein
LKTFYENNCFIFFLTGRLYFNIYKFGFSNNLGIFNKMPFSLFSPKRKKLNKKSIKSIVWRKKTGKIKATGKNINESGMELNDYTTDFIGS